MHMPARYTSHMRIPFFSRASKTFIVADVGAGGSAAGFLIQEDGPGLMQAAARSHPSLEERGPDAALAQLARTFAESADAARAQAAKAGVHAPEAAYIIIRSPWTVSRCLSIERAFDTETAVTDDLISSLAKEALSKGAEAASELLEASVVHIELNGYPVASPAGKKARHLKVAVLVSTMEKQYRDAITAVAQKAFPGIPLKLRSHVRTLLVALKNEQHDRNCVVIDLADDGTTVSVVRKNLLDSETRIAAGVQTLLARIAKTGSREETLALLSMLEKGTCTSAACDEITQALSAAEPELTKIFGEGLATLATQRRLPNDAYLMAQSDIAAWFAQFLARIDFAQFTLTSQPLSVHVVGPAEFESLVHLSPGVMTDPGLCLAAALVHSEQHSGIRS